MVDGAARDVAGLRALGLPAFSRAVTPRNYHYPAGVEHGAVNVPVVCAGTLVEPGDIVVGDDDGVLVVPRRIAAEIVTAATAFLENEKGFRAMLATRLTTASDPVPRPCEEHNDSLSPTDCLT